MIIIIIGTNVHVNQKDHRLVTFGEVVSRKNNEFRDCNHVFLKNHVILLDNTHREGYNIVAKDGDEYETIRNE